MGLPWVRQNSDLASQREILNLLADQSPKRWQAAFSHRCAVGWSAANETDGLIPRVALPFVHATTMTARLLVIHLLWEEHRDGWMILRFAEEQQTSVVTAAKSVAARLAGEKANCVRWHGASCWVKDQGCSRAPS